jgi:hypothetical protein
LLPKKLLNLGLSDEQRAKCEAAYQEIFTPEIIAQQEEVVQKQRGLERGSAEYMKIEKENSEKFKQYNSQLNEKLKGILTKEQQDKYFGKTGKNDSKGSVKATKSDGSVKATKSGGSVKPESESADDQYEVIDTPFGAVKRKINK